MHRDQLHILRSTVAGLLLAATLGATAAPSNAQQPASARPVAAGGAVLAVLVGLRPGATLAMGLHGPSSSDQALEASVSALSVQSADAVFPTLAGSGQVSLPGIATPIDLRAVYRLRLPAGGNVAAAVSALSANPAVIYAEPDAIAHLITTPNDPLFSQQWGLAQIGAPAAWSVVTGSSSVAIAVIDSGLDTTHPDLAGQLWTNPGEIAGNSLDDDNDGHVDDIHGWNLLGNNADLSDNNGHGSEVAGIAAAATNNGAGVAGVCWTCKLMVVKVAQPSGVANYSDIAAGVAYAAQKGAKVINLSLGGNSDSITLRAAIASAAASAVIVGGAGNDNSNALFYPAAYPDVLAVAGTTVTDTKVATSNFGSWVDVTAPGEAITTTFSGGTYGASSGTSLAAPFAAGLAGLLFSQHPAWSAAEVRAQIVHTAHNINAQNPSYSGQLGSGRIDAASAVTTAAAPVVSVQSYTVNGVANGNPDPGTVADVSITLYNDWGTASNLQATLTGGGAHASVLSATVGYGALGTYESQPNGGTLRINIASAAGFGASLPFTLHLTADGGFAADLPVTLTTQSAVQPVSGMIGGNQVWTPDKTYLITGNTLINNGASLTIEPGTVVKFNGSYDLYIAGTLVAIGTANNTVKFTSNKAQPQPGDWHAIIFEDNSTDASLAGDGTYLSGSTLQFVDVEYGGTILAFDSSPYVANSTFRHNTPPYSPYAPNYFADTGAVTFNNSNTTFENNVVEDNLGTGIKIDGGGSVVILHDLVQNNQSGLWAGGINCMAGECRVISSDVLDNVWTATDQGGSGGIFTYEGSLIISDTLIAGNIGLATASTCGGSALGKCFGDVTAFNNTIVGNSGFAAYHALEAHSTDSITGNNIVGNTGPNSPYYNVYTPSDHPAASLSMTVNYWGTTNTGLIDASIFDFNDDLTSGQVFYQPIATHPITTAPPFLVDATVNPNPAGIQTATFLLTFSRPMDQSLSPAVTFGVTAPYTSFVVLDNAQWVSPTLWSGTYDITSLVPKGVYTVSVSDAQSENGRAVANDTRFAFTVDYAGQITDQSLPGQPPVFASGVNGVPGTAKGAWQAPGSGSPIIHYRYAIGTAAGTVDVVNWTLINATSVTRTGLGLASGHHYWFSVQAQNQGGLWSLSSSNEFVAGVKKIVSLFLPLTRR